MTERNTDIELVYKDIKYIKDDMAEIKASLKLVLEHYITKEEVESRFIRLQQELDKRFDGSYAQLEKKLNKEDFMELKIQVNSVKESSSIKWGSIAQSVITTILTTAIIGGLTYTLLIK
jgi:hypothetical protein